MARDFAMAHRRIYVRISSTCLGRHPYGVYIGADHRADSLGVYALLSYSSMF